VVLKRVFFLSLWLLALTVPSTPVWAKRNKKSAAAPGEKLPDLNEILTNAGWTITPEMSASYSTPGDIFDGNNGLQKLGPDCFDTKPREGAYTSMEVNRSLTAGVRMNVLVAGTRAGLQIEKKLVFDTPTHRQIPSMDLVPNEACLKSFERARSRGTDMSNWYVITEALSAVIQKQECGSYNVSAGGFVLSGDVEVQQLCDQTSLEPVAVAYKTAPVWQILPKVELRVGAIAPEAQRAAPAEDKWSTLMTKADAFMYGRGVPEDRRKAELLYKQACDSGLAEACAELAVILWWGQRASGENKPRASNLMRVSLAALEVGCKQGNMRACMRQATALAEGLGTGENDARAAELYGQACSGGDLVGCNNLGLMYKNGEGVPKNTARAVKLYEQACSGGEAGGCNNLGTLYDKGEGVPKDDARAAELFEQACSGGEATGCNNLGVLYKNGEGVPKNTARAAELYEQACSGGEGTGCFNLGVLYDNGEGVPKNAARAAKLYEQACSGGEAGGCYNLGSMYQFGEGVPKDDARAVKLYEQACSGGEGTGCYNLGMMYHTGEGVRNDPSQAKRYFGKACDLGEEAACNFK
jgi:TPR repeat protein